MGLIACTCTQMAAEDLTIPADFEDFSEKEDLEALFKLLLKLAKVPHSPAAQGLLREVASFIIPAKSMIHIDGARKAVNYYKLVGRAIEPKDLFWPVIKKLVEQ